MSFLRDSYYSVLYDRRFVSYFANKISNSFPDIDYRFSNSFCSDKYRSDYFSQSFTWTDRNSARDFDRYKMINFLSAFGKFGTMEFRIFPSRPVEDLYEYTKTTVKIVNSYLDKHLREFGDSVEILLTKTRDEYKNSDYLLLPKNMPIVF